MKNRDWMDWCKKAGIRAIKTIAECAISLIPVATTIQQVDWKMVLGSAILAGILSLLASIVGLPEETNKEEIQNG